MYKRLSLLFVFLLLFQSISYGIGTPNTIQAVGTNNDSIISELAFTDENGKVLTLKEASEEEIVILQVDWKIESAHIEAEDREYLFDVPNGLIIEESQKGTLLVKEEEYGKYTAEGNILSITLGDLSEEAEGAEGTFEIKATGLHVPEVEEEVQTTDEDTDAVEKEEDSESTNANEQAIEEGTVEAEESEEADKEATEREDSEDATKEDAEEAADEGLDEETTEIVGEESEEKTEEVDAEEEESIWSKVAGFFSFNILSDDTEITENIITDVNISIDTGDGYESVEKGDIIRVVEPYNEFKVKIRYDFSLPNDHGYKNGATYTIQLPEMLTIQNNLQPRPLLDETGIQFASFIVEDNKVIITFNEKIEEKNNISGYIEGESEFAAHYDGAADTKLTFPIEGGATVEYPVKFIKKGSSISKKGEGNKGYNTEIITWTVDFNKDFQEIENAILTDEITEGDHEFVAGSLKVYELELNADGTILNTTEVHGFGDSFPLSLGNIDSPYRVVYETKVNDREGINYKNKATLDGDNVEPVNAEATVGVTRGEALTKESTHYDDIAQTIKWEVKYNYDEKNIEQALAKLTDIFGDNQELDLDSFEVYEVTINQETGVEDGESLVGASEYTVTPVDNGFELQFENDIDKAYKIYYTTKTTERVIDGFNVDNTISDEFENTRRGGQFVSQGVFIKSHDDKPNYDTKETSWTILINRDKQPMNDVIFYDTLPEGMTPKNVVVTHGGTTLNAGTDYTYTYDEETRKITVDFLFDIDDTVYIKYDTDIDYNIVDWNDISFTNTSTLEWIPWNETEKLTKTGTATFTPDDYTKHNGFKSADYNPVTKEITWTIGVNYNKAELEGVVVEDFIERADAQDFNIENVKVYEMILTGDENGFKIGNEATEATYEIAPVTGPDGESGFRVNFGDISTPYVIQYMTSLKGHLIEGEYKNTATVKTTNAKDSELDASIKPYDGKEYTEKNANQNEANPRIVNWTMKINFNQSTVTNLKIEDTPSINQSIIKDSFKLYGTKVTENGVEKDPSNILEKGKDYNVFFEEVGEDGQEKFIFKTYPEDESSDKAYVLEYDTYILYTGGEHDNITNEATFHAKEGVSSEAGDKFSRAVNLSSIGGGITGNVGMLQIKKKSDDPKVKELLKGAEFELYDQDGEVLLRTGTTDENGVVTFKNLLQGKYLLKETAAPEYHIIGKNAEQIVEVNSSITELEIENEKIKQHFELTKIDDKDKTPLQGAEFELYVGTHPNGTKVENLNLKTDENGKILVENLPEGNRDEGIPAGDYYLLETKAANEHYEVSTKPISFTIREDQTVVTKKNATNKLKPGSVSFTKVDSETNKQLAGAKFNIVYVEYKGKTYNEIIETVTTTDNETTVIDNLRPGEYKLVEVEAPTGYKPLENAIEFTIEESQETTLELGKIKNEVKTTSITLTKQDTKKPSKKLEDVEFELTYISGDYASSFETKKETTDSSGVITFSDLKPGKYKIEELTTPEGYIKSNDPIEVEVGLIDVHSEKVVPVTVKNDPFAEIILEKRNSETKYPLQGAVFEVVDRDDDSKVLTGLTTNSEGRIQITGLPAGNYKLVEIESPNGYHDPGTGEAFEREFSITGNETTTNTIEFVGDEAVKNDIVKGSLEITKQDAEDASTKLPNVEFTLQSVELVDGGLPYKETKTTDVDGKVKFDGLWPGTYKLVETKAADGYQKHWKEIDITINKQNEEHEATITVENYELVDIPVTKVWNDGGAGARPDVTIKLNGASANNDKFIEKTYTLTKKDAVSGDNNAWSYTFEDLPAVDNQGAEITYTVEEVAVDGYLKGKVKGDSEEGYVITNVLKTEIEVEKVWKDEDADEREPVTIYLQRNANKEYKSITFDGKEDKQSAKFENLPVYDTDGEPYLYEVYEVDSSGKYKSIKTGNNEEGYTFTNIRTGKRDIVVSKEWKDGDDKSNRPEEIRITLFKKGTIDGELKEEKQDYVKITPVNDIWQYKFENLDAFDEEGKAFEYRVEEDSILNYVQQGVVEETTDGFKITNVRTGKTSVSGEKIWKHDEGLDNPTIQVQLYQNDNPVQDQVVTVSAETDWKYEFTDLDEFDVEGKPYEYSVKEVEVPEGYDSTVDGYDITNTRVGTTNVEVAKVWLDENTKDRPDSITLQLYQNGTPLKDATVTNPESETDTWKYVFEDLEAFDENGKAYTYTVDEVVPEGYKQVSNVTKDDGSITITNVRSEEMEIDVTKRWVDTEETASRPESITIQLFQKDDDGKEELVSNSTRVITPDADGKWAYTYTNIPKFDESGNAIEYIVKEQFVPGYTSYPGDVENGIAEITNIRTGTIAISGNKTWLDDHSPERPDEITVLLKREGDDDFVQEQTVSVEQEWKYSFGGLAQFNDEGIEYKYYIEEMEIDGYKTEVDGYNLINKRVGTTTVEGTKTWKDGGDLENRPNDITVILTREGDTKFEKTTTVQPDEDGNWTYKFDNLEKYDDQGVEYEYVISEKRVDGYKSKVEGYDIINIRSEQTSITVTKEWKDDNDATETRPDHIVVELYRSDDTSNAYRTQVIRPANGWQHSFENLELFDEEGQRYTYEVKELPVAGYKTKQENATDGVKITNVREGKTSVEITKKWNDNSNAGSRPAEIEVELYRSDDADEPLETATMKANDNGEWHYTFTDLDEFDQEGVKYEYTVKEKAIDGYKQESIVCDTENSFVITNVATTSIDVTKEWLDDEDETGRKEITVTLYQNEEEHDQANLTEAADWKHTFTNLPMYDALGKRYDYKVEEDESTLPDSYEIKEIKGNTESGFVITNVRVGETDVFGTKFWNDANDQDGVRPDEITVNLLANGKKVDSTTVKEVDGEWKYEFTGLEKYDANGVEINYTVTEDSVDHYSTEINGFDITNSHTPEETSVTVTKHWDDDHDRDQIRPEKVEVQLIADENKIGEPIELSKDNDWTHTWTELPLNAEGTPIKYTVEEITEVDGYTTTIDDADHGNIMITNTHIPEVIEITVTKTWDDANNQDGIRPESIDVILLADDKSYREAIITGATDWKHTFKDLPKYDQGKEIEYTIQEVAVEDYETIYDGYNIINSYEPEVITIEGTKTWDDADNQDGIRPESITVNLLANGNPVDSIEVTEADNWEYSFTDVPKYANGEEINYTVTENVVDGYTPSIEGFDITNSYTPGKTAVTVTKHWDDANNQDGVRPASIEVQLTANGEDFGKVVELSETNNWTHTWTDLDEKAAGETIVYSVKELTELPEYDTIINDEDHGNIIITNKLIDEEPVVEVSTEKPGTTTTTVAKGTSDKKDDLPNTATNMFNTLMVGTAIFISGLGALVVARRRKQDNK